MTYIARQEVVEGGGGGCGYGSMSTYIQTQLQEGSQISGGGGDRKIVNMYVLGQIETWGKVSQEVSFQGEEIEIYKWIFLGGENMLDIKLKSLVNSSGTGVFN